VQIGGIFIGQPQLVAGAICLLSFVALWLFVTRTETGLGLQATAPGPAGGSSNGHPDRAHVGSRLGDRARLRRGGGHAALDVLSTYSPTWA
jgi:hypothetical protein